MTSTAIPSPTLKPCPFCGCSDAVVREYPAYRIDGKPCGDSTFGVDCLNCGVETNKYSSDGPAIRDWNTRSPSSSEDVRRMWEALEACAASWDSGPTTLAHVPALLSAEFQRRLNIAGEALAALSQKE